MLNILKTNTRFLIRALALGTMLPGFYSWPLNAQTNTSEYDFLGDIEAGTNVDWSFSSEDESLAVTDDLKELGEYNISDSDSEGDVELIGEEQKWGNRGDVEDFSFEAEVYDY